MKRMNRQAAALCLFLLLFVLFLALPAAAQDEMLEQLAPQSWIDWAIVFLSIGAVELLKMALPSPEGESRWSAKVTAGVNRVLPFAPLVMAAVLYLVWNYESVGAVPIGQIVGHGAALGVYSGYLYRAGKVTVFGA
jgi:hypothetical protein